MKQKTIFLFLISFSSFLFAQSNKEKELIFKIKYEKTVIKIIPDKSWLYSGETAQIEIVITPNNKKIGKVTFKGGNIAGKDGIYTITAGSGSEGILSIYEKNADGNKLITNKIYEFKKIL